MKEVSKHWIRVGKILANDPTAKVTCPECKEGDLQTKDSVERNTIERKLFCPLCGAHNFLSRSIGNPD